MASGTNNRFTYCLAFSLEVCVIQLPYCITELRFPQSYCPICQFSLEIPPQTFTISRHLSIQLRRLVYKPSLETCSAPFFLGLDLLFIILIMGVIKQLLIGRKLIIIIKQGLQNIRDRLSKRPNYPCMDTNRTRNFAEGLLSAGGPDMGLRRHWESV